MTLRRLKGETRLVRAVARPINRDFFCTEENQRPSLKKDKSGGLYYTTNDTCCTLTACARKTLICQRENPERNEKQKLLSLFFFGSFWKSGEEESSAPALALARVVGSVARSFRASSCPSPAAARCLPSRLPHARDFTGCCCRRLPARGSLVFDETTGREQRERERERVPMIGQSCHDS